MLRWASYIEDDWIKELDESRFLEGCRKGTVSKDELLHFLAQQYHYSREFTRYLCALLANIENEKDRRELTENLVDETGLGTVKGTPHSILYREMMKRMGVDPDKTEATSETQALIDTMLESCRNSNSAVGLGALCLGAEAIVPHVYSQIVQGFERHGYTKEDLDFFYLHIGCDDEHALTMKKIIDREIGDERKRQMLKCSARRVIAARARFFNSLSMAKERTYDAAL